MKHFDTIIIGGGMAGTATAEALTQQGQNILLIEQFDIAHNQGSSHGDSRIFRLGYPDPTYVEMALQAKQGWSKLHQRVGRPLIQTTGIWECGPIGGLWIEELIQIFDRFQLPYQRITAAESRQKYPHFALSETSEVLYHPDAGVVFPDLTIKSLWQLVQDSGGSLCTKTKVVNLTLQGERVIVETDTGQSWSADRVVIAAGGWSTKLLAMLDLHLPLTVTQEQVAYFQPKKNAHPPHELGMMLPCSDYHLEHSFFVVPQVDVSGVKAPGVKVGWHHTGDPIEPDLPLPLNENVLTRIQQFVTERLPYLDPTPAHCHRCLYTNTPDGNFILDRHPERPQIIIGTGFSGHGFKFAPTIGEILAALVLDEEPPVDIGMFSVQRF